MTKEQVIKHLRRLSEVCGAPGRHDIPGERDYDLGKADAYSHAANLIEKSKP